MGQLWQKGECGVIVAEEAKSLTVEMLVEEGGAMLHMKDR